METEQRAETALGRVARELQHSAGSIQDQHVREYGTAEQIGALYTALAAAAGGFAPVAKTKEVKIRSDKGAYSYSYAPLNSLVAATRPALAQQGVVVLLPPSGEMGTIHMIVSHKAGGRLVVTLEFRPNERDIKLWGGQTTYLRRYLYQGFFMLDGDDELDADKLPEAPESGASQSKRAERKAPKRQEGPPRSCCSRTRSARRTSAHASRRWRGSAPASAAT